MLLLGLYPLPFPVLPSTVNREPSRLVAASPLSLRLVTAVLLACWPTCSSRSHGFFPFAKTHCKRLLLQGGSCVSQHFPDLCVRVTWKPQRQRQTARPPPGRLSAGLGLSTCTSVAGATAALGLGASRTTGLTPGLLLGAAASGGRSHGLSCPSKADLPDFRCNPDRHFLFDYFHNYFRNIYNYQLTH